jgi:glutamyl-tRNA reductase
VRTERISGARVAHDDADLDTIERAAAPDGETIVRRLLVAEGVSEAFALQTCHRVEAYVVTEDAESGRAALDAQFPGSAVHTGHEDSLRHLLRVAAGLESLVLGEDQVLGQVREAYEAARRAGGIGPVLEDAVTKAIHVGERARTETAINEGVVSLGSAAVELAGRELGLDDSSALVVGAGEMGTLAARAFADAGVADLVVANRSPERARRVVADIGEGEVAGLAELDAAFADADVVVTATGSEEPVLDEAVVGGGDALVVDLGQPRDVAPAAAAEPDVSTYDIDDLERVTEATHERRRAAADRVAAMVDREFDRLLEQFKRSRADSAIAAMYEGAERTKERELREALAKLDARGELSDGQREAVESLADALVSQLLAAPTKSLREAAADDDWETIVTALRLFNPEFPDGAVDAEAMPAGPPPGATSEED